MAPLIVKILEHELGLRAKAQNGNEIMLEIPKDALIKAATLLTSQSGKLVLMAGADLRESIGSFQLNYVFAVPHNLFVQLLVPVLETEPTFPSLTLTIPAADWYEREVKDMFGLVPLGHPDPRRLILHEHWPRGVHPLRKDYDATNQAPRGEAEFNLHQVDREGVFEIPVGPIHAGIIEPGHFRFSTVGEEILDLEAKLFYTHKGTEKLCEGKSFDQVLQIAERICGACSISNATAFCLAAEKLTETEVPDRAVYIRTLALELERLYNHIGDVGNICAGTGFAFGVSQGGRLREMLLSLNEQVFGNRYLRGINSIGGVRRELTTHAIKNIRETLRQVEIEFGEVTQILLANDSLLDRLATTGILKAESAQELGVVGPAARASGVDVDTRRDHPYLAYPHLDFQVVLAENGDVLDRVKVRIGEATQSFFLVDQLLSKLPEGKWFGSVGDAPVMRSALGYVESPRGQVMHYLMAGPGNTVYRYMVRSASYTNWPAVPLAVMGNIVPDFPLINKSFELCYSCLDR
jgi:hydrogenase-4 component G